MNSFLTYPDSSKYVYNIHVFKCTSQKNAIKFVVGKCNGKLETVRLDI